MKTLKEKEAQAKTQTNKKRKLLTHAKEKEQIDKQQYIQEKRDTRKEKITKQTKEKGGNS